MRNCIRSAAVTVAAVVGLLGVLLPARGAVITIQNAGFESPALTDSGSTDSNIPNWTEDILQSRAGGFSFGVFNPPASAYPAEAPEGANVAYINNGRFAQTLSSNLAANTVYTLDLLVGNDARTTSNGNFLVELLAGTTVLNSITGTTNVIPEGTFAARQLVFTSPPTVTAGQPLKIRLSGSPVSGGDPNIGIDNLRLSANPVPEPATAGLLAAAAAALGLRRRPRRG
jgi:hypothetical protein